LLSVQEFVDPGVRPQKTWTAIKSAGVPENLDSHQKCRRTETSDGKLNSETGTETWAAIKFRSVPVPELPGLVAVPKFRRICCLSKSSSIQEFVQAFEEFVKTGENSGRKLIQSYVVRAFRPAA